MIEELHPPLVPKDGKTLKVIGVTRISTDNQDERSLADQEAKLRRFMADHYADPVEWHFISSRGSGEYLDRKELFELEECIEAAEHDLVISEDLARICRRRRAYDLCELCVDNAMRLIALNDRVDTAQEGWEDSAFISTWHHERSNRDTSARIKRTLRNRFLQGGVFQFPIFGYIKPAGAKSDKDVQKDPKAEPIYDEWFQRLENDNSFEEVADWLHSIGIPVGKHCRSKRWNGRMVARITFNPILKGERQRNNKMSVRTNKTGRRTSKKAPPNMLLQRACPHLAFIEPARYDRVIRKLISKNAKYARGRKAAQDRRNGVSRKRTVWPGQHITCGVCGRLYYWGGHGQPKHMMCSGCRDYKCWNGVTFDGTEAGPKLCQAILDEIERLPDFEPTFLALLREKMEAQQSGAAHELKKVAKEIDSKGKQVDRVTTAIAELGASRALTDKLRRLEIDLDHLVEQHDLLRKQPAPTAVLPSFERIKSVARETFKRLDLDNPEFCRLMRQLVPSIRACPVRFCDNDALVIRAHVVLYLVPLVSDGMLAKALEAVLRRESTLDLFEPPQRAKFREQVVAMRADGLKERQIATKLKITQTAVQRAAALHRLMLQKGLTDPYIPVTEPSVDGPRLRRHISSRYRFEPLKDQQQA